MGIRYSELPKTNVPTENDLVALLDMESATLKTTTIAKLVKCALGNADISEIGDGTVNGAIVYLYNGGGGGGAHITAMTQEEYDALTEEQRHDGNLRFVVS